MRDWFKHPIFRVSIALLVLALTLIFNLSPGTPGSLVARASGFLGGSDATDANAHIALFLGLTCTWYYAASTYLAPHPACWSAVGLGLVLGTLTELAQRFVPERGTTLIDLLANWTGVTLFGIGFMLVGWMQMKRTQQRS